jgi:retron-type reverse transcriptase
MHIYTYDLETDAFDIFQPKTHRHQLSALHRISTAHRSTICQHNTNGRKPEDLVLHTSDAGAPDVSALKEPSANIFASAREFDL